MKSKIRKLAIVGVTVLSIGGSSCHAGPILDWLFPNRAARREASNVGQLTLRVPLDGYQYNMSGYSPTTSYRSVWAPVPVTQYRPVSYVNPLSTGTQTNMLPCSTQQWQARRVPYTSYQPSSLFGGGSGWQTVGQTVPAASYPAVTAGYAGSQVNYEQTTPWASVTPSSVTTNYGSAAFIENGWTAVGSGVSYAAPADGGTGLLSYGSAPNTVRRAGYPDAQSFSPSGITPLPSSMDPSTWRPIANAEYDDICENEPSDYDPSLSGEKSLGTQSNTWTPLHDDSSDEPSRSQVTPADISPTLPERTERRRAESGLHSDPYDWKAIDPASDDDKRTRERSKTERDTSYRPPQSFNAKNRQVRPAMPRQDDPYYATEAKRDGYQDDDAGAAAAQAVPYPKPIPDLNRNQRQPTIPNLLLDDADERTASVRVAPHGRAVPIDWNQVDIGRQGGLKRAKSPVTKVNMDIQAPMMELAPAKIDEGGWRRVR